MSGWPVYFGQLFSIWRDGSVRQWHASSAGRGCLVRGCLVVASRLKSLRQRWRFQSVQAGWQRLSATAEYESGCGTPSSIRTAAPESALQAANPTHPICCCVLCAARSQDIILNCALLHASVTQHPAFLTCLSLFRCPPAQTAQVGDCLLRCSPTRHPARPCARTLHSGLLYASQTCRCHLCTS